MLRCNLSQRCVTAGQSVRSPGGFTLVEMIIVMVVAGIIIIPIYTFFNTSFNQYISLQADGSSFSDLAIQSQRVATVLRGATSINSVSANDIDCYAYFAPSDTYVSRIHYYKNTVNTVLYADVTRMTANPPIGTPIAGSTHTFTIIPTFYQATGISTFTYLDDVGNALALPITDFQTIKAVRVTLAVPAGKLSKTSNQTVSVQVSLRNRKVNL